MNTLYTPQPPNREDLMQFIQQALISSYEEQKVKVVVAIEFAGRITWQVKGTLAVGNKWSKAYFVGQTDRKGSQFTLNPAWAEFLAGERAEIPVKGVIQDEQHEPVTITVADG